MKKFLLLLFVLAFCLQVTAQVSISVDNSTPDPSAMLDVKSSDKGFLPPRMTTEQMNGIITPLEGLLVYNTSVNSLYWFNGVTWKRFNEFNYTETDPVFALHAASGITGVQIGEWNTAYSWGNHAAAGYLTSYTETDPIFITHPAYGITNTTINNWNAAYNNRITSASGTAPLSLIITNNQLTGSMTASSSITNGYLTSTDWNTFNGKQNALSFGSVTSSDLSVTGGTGAVVGSGLVLTINKGSLTSSDLTISGGSNAVLGSGTVLTVKKSNLAEATSSVLTITGGSNAVLGTGTTIQVKQATTSQSGYLSNTDWNTFNNKQSTLTFGNLTSSDITVTGGTGAVKGTGAGLTINKGNLTSSDIAVTGGSGSVLGTGTALTINKGNLTESGSSVLTVTGGDNSVVGVGTSIQVKQANTSQSGYLSSGDWNSFNDKVSSQWTANGTKLHYNTGNIGIGTTNPQSKVDIAGNAVIGSSFSGTSAAPANGLLVEGKVGFGTTSPTASAALEVTSTNSGLLLPRMTRVQRNAIVNIAEGLMVYCTNCGTNGSLSIFTNGTWMTFSPCAIAASIASSPVMSQGQIIWNWIAVSGAAGYKWNTTPDYETAIDMGTTITKTETGTICGTTYTRYIWAYSSCGESSITMLTATVPVAVPVSPVASTHVATLTSITWNWNSVPDAIGYRWNTTNDYASAIEMGTATSKPETGLACGTPYTRYVWAYNGCGYSASVALNQSTLACWICGDPLTKNHLSSGGVAPVDKTVTYGTVNNIPGELTKCWITRNLGAAQQATSVSDATEASAGWYFQFNRKQGYQWISSRIPDIAWDATNDNLSATWEAAKDPCTLELGNGWRIPTNTEWTNVDASGNWTDWNGPYNSALKLHAAGHLDISDGSLGTRGSYGYYWSSTQIDATYSWYLFFGSGSSYMGNGNGKAIGFSARCIKDN